MIGIRPILSFWGPAFFYGAFAVSFREGLHLHQSETYRVKRKTPPNHPDQTNEFLEGHLPRTAHGILLRHLLSVSRLVGGERGVWIRMNFKVENWEIL